MRNLVVLTLPPQNHIRPMCMYRENQFSGKIQSKSIVGMLLEDICLQRWIRAEVLSV